MSHRVNRHGVQADPSKILDQVLEVMRRCPGIKVAALAKELGVSRQTVYRALAIPRPPRVPLIPTISADELSEPVAEDDTPTVPRLKAVGAA